MDNNSAGPRGVVAVAWHGLYFPSLLAAEAQELPHQYQSPIVLGVMHIGVLWSTNLAEHNVHVLVYMCECVCLYVCVCLGVCVLFGQQLLAGY